VRLDKQGRGVSGNKPFSRGGGGESKKWGRWRAKGLHEISAAVEAERTLREYVKLSTLSVNDDAWGRQLRTGKQKFRGMDGKDIEP